MCFIRWTESYPNNNLDWKTRSKFCINILEPDRWTNSSIFLRNKDPQKLIIHFVIIGLLAEKNKLEMRTKFQEVDRVIMSWCPKLSKDERCRYHSTVNFEYEDDCIKDTEETDMSFQFLRMQKNQLIDLKQNLERFVNTLPVFGLNSWK